jgi:hypothetical protein
MFYKFFFCLITVVGAINDPNVSNSKNTSKDSDLFSQDVKMVFYDNLNECLNNGDKLLIDNSYYNTDCDCLNSTQCLNKLFSSNNFREHLWNINNTMVNGSQCNFKFGRLCDTCGDYMVKTDTILYGVNCSKNLFSNLLISLFVIFLGLIFTLSIIYCIHSLITNQEGYRIISRKRYGYNRIVNDTNGPPSYN